MQILSNLRIDQNPDGRLHLIDSSGRQKTYKTLFDVISEIGIDDLIHQFQSNHTKRGTAKPDLKQQVRIVEKYLEKRNDGTTLPQNLKAVLYRTRKRKDFTADAAQHDEDTVSRNIRRNRRIADKTPVYDQLPSLFDVLRNPPIGKKTLSILPAREDLFSSEQKERVLAVSRPTKASDITITLDTLKTPIQGLDNWCFRLVLKRSKGNKKYLSIDMILWFRKTMTCFGKIVNMRNIIKTIKKIADNSGATYIKLDDQSHIPLRSLRSQHISAFNESATYEGKHPPFFKVLFSLATGKTLYMNYGFFCLPSKILKDARNDMEAYPASHDLILRNLVVLNRISAFAILHNAQSIPVSQVIPGDTATDETLSSFASSLIDRLKADDDDAIREYDQLSRVIFGRKQLWQMSANTDNYNTRFSQFLISHLANEGLTGWESIRETMRAEPLFISVPFVMLPTVEERKEELIMLLMCLATGFASTEMLRKADGTWMSFTLPGSGSPPV